MVELEVFSGHQSFAIVSELKDLKDTGGIFDLNMGLLAYFRHEHNWRTPRGPVKIWRQARATDIYLESVDGILLGEINEIPPKLFTMRLIRNFEIYNDRKELVGAVKEKPKAIGSDWVLEDLDGKVIAVVAGDRGKKEYEIQTPDGQVLVKSFREVIDRIFRDSKLNIDSYRVDVSGWDVDLFLLLSYVLVLEFAKVGWTTRGSFLGRYIGKKEVEKEHLLKTQEAQMQVDTVQSYERASKYAKRILALTIVHAALLFSVATPALLKGSSGSWFFYVIGITGLIFAISGFTNVKTKKSNTITILMGAYSVLGLSIITGLVTMPFSELSQGRYIIAPEGYFFAALSFIVSVAILVNVQLSMGFWDDFIKK